MAEFIAKVKERHQYYLAQENCRTIYNLHLHMLESMISFLEIYPTDIAWQHKTIKIFGDLYGAPALRLSWTEAEWDHWWLDLFYFKRILPQIPQ